jgi:hypothetical protein
MLAGELSEEEGSGLIAATLTELDGLLERNPGARETAIRILDARLTDPSKVNSWDDLVESLGAFLGRDLAYLLSWVSYGDWEERMSKVSGLASPEVVQLIRELIGIYGNDIRRAMIVRDLRPDDWVGLRLSTLENRLAGDYRISVEIDKVKGESVGVEGPPDSILNLVRHILTALNAVGNPAAFSQDRIDAFREQVGELEKLLAAGQPSETAEGAEAGTAVVATADASPVSEATTDNGLPKGTPAP